MKKTEEFAKFDRAMDSILRADPKAVKEAMERERHAQEQERNAKGERKRGRKQRAKNDN
jgi:hypothetical protein